MRRLTCLVFAIAALSAPARGAEPEAKPIAARTEPDVKPEAKPPAPHGGEAEARPDLKPDLRPGGRHACLAAAETREEIKALHLREPYAVLKFAAQHFKAEALSAKLCRVDDELVYEIALLHRDGKFMHAHVSATTGKLIELKRAAAPPAPKT